MQKRTTALGLGVVLAVTLVPGAGAVAVTGPGIDPDDARALAPDSFWYRELPNRTPVAPNSGAVVEDLVRQAEERWGEPGEPNLAVNTRAWTPTIYRADAGDPLVSVGFDNCQGKPSGEKTVQQLFLAPDAALKNVRIPAEARPPEGGDGEMIVIDTASGKLIELWQARKSADGRWSACWGGVSPIGQNTGTFERPFGVTASGLSMLGGTILAEELAAGEIDHVVGIALPYSAGWSSVSQPANRADGGNPKGYDVPSQGQMFRLPADLDLDTLNLAPASRAIAEAAQNHGLVVWDTSGSVSLRLENELGMASNPYAEIFGTPNYSDVFDPDPAAGRDGFPFHELELLPMHYSAPASGQAARPAHQPTQPTQPPQPAPPPAVQPELPKPAMQPGDRAFLGDWDGDGRESWMVRRGNFHRYWLGTSTDAVAGAPAYQSWYGTATDELFVGDWDGDGVDTVAIRRGNAIHYKNDLGSGSADLVEIVGRPGDAVTVADPRGNGRERVVLAR